MKKTIKIAGLLFAAAMVFTGCTQPTSSSSSPNYNEPLFSENDVTVDATKYEIADGNWIFRQIQKTDTSSTSDHFEFVFKNGQVDTSADMKYITNTSGTLPEGISQAEIDAAVKDLGYKIDGNKYSYSKEYNKEAILKIIQKMTADPSLMNGKNRDQETLSGRKIINAMTYANTLNGKTAPAGCKTNAEKTKYMWKNEHTNTNSSGTTTKLTTTSYLSKK